METRPEGISGTMIRGRLLRPLSGARPLHPKKSLVEVRHASDRYCLLALLLVLYKQVVYSQPQLIGICKFIGCLVFSMLLTVDPSYSVVVE